MIIYTHTDEAPLLATYSLEPIFNAFLAQAGVEISPSNISLAQRILAAFNDTLPESQRVPESLNDLGALTQDPAANIIKLPNISASIPQLEAAITELQGAGYDIPDYPHEAVTAEQKDAQQRYDSVKGSAVNPVLREGNSDRRAPEAVKNYVKQHPHSMGVWSSDSATRVLTMDSGDFRHNEQSIISPQDDVLTVVHITSDGETVLKEIPVQEREIIDATVLNVSALDEFLAQTLTAAQDSHTLWSIHLKATMMKVSDPIIFGHAVRAFFSDTFKKYGSELMSAGLTGENGLAAIYSALSSLPNGSEIQKSFEDEFSARPDIAMVNSDKGITNLHVPSDIIVDASMPAMIRNSGQAWNAQGNPEDTIAVIPDSSYAGVYQATIEDCKAHGAFDPTTMGTVPNVGLMAQKAEEYGSHDKTFRIVADGTVQVRNGAGEVLMEHAVSQGDIWRACQTKDIPLQNWVKLAVTRARKSGMPAIFWLDPERAHDRNVEQQVRTYLDEYDLTDLDIDIQDPVTATKTSLERIRKGQDTISVTGNVLRDYLTDLFPIMELGTSAKMLSIVPLIAGGGLFETGAGGSAPKHVQQLQEENHLRWDSLGEFLAMGESLRQVADAESNAQANVLADTLDTATEELLNTQKSPGRKVMQIDNRGSHFYLALYWAQALAEQTQDAELATIFAPVAQQLAENETVIADTLINVQGKPVDFGGYYNPNPELLTAVMRPSPEFNAIIDGLISGS